MNQLLRHFVFDLLEHRAGHADAARRGQWLDAGGHVHAITVDVAGLRYHVANMDADSDADLPFDGLRLIALAEGSLQSNGALHRRQCAGEFDQKTVAGRFHLAPAVPRENGANDHSMLLQQLQRERLVPLRQRAVAHHVGEHNGGEFAVLGVLRGHGRIKPELRRKEIKENSVGRTARRPSIRRCSSGKSKPR